MSKKDVISRFKMLCKAPYLLSILPSMSKSKEFALIEDPKKPLGLGWIIERAVGLNPDGNAILYDDFRMTYREYNEWVNRFAHYFISRGVKKGDVVAVFIENRPELLACVGAIAKVGAVSAMLNTSQRDKVLIHSCNLVDSKLAVVGEELVEAFNDIRSEVNIGEDDIYYLAEQNTLENPGTAPEGYINLAAASAGFPTNNPDTTNKIYKADPCFYIYTSGTTGLPKAAILTHGRLMKGQGGLGMIAVRMEKDDVMYSTLPFYHSTAIILCWGPALVAGAGFATRKKFSAREFLSDVRKYNATFFGYVGEICRYLMNTPEKPDDADNPISGMVGVGLRPDAWNAFKKRFGIKRVIEMYASSEGPTVFMNVFNFDNTVGICFTPFAIVKYDKDSGEPFRNAEGFMERVKTGEAGLLLSEISPTTPFEGYTDGSKNEKCLVRDAFEKDDIWYNTGDYMRDIGFRHAQFVDRLGDTYRWKGENVSTTEVENILYTHNDIEETVAYGVEIPNTNGRAGMVSIVAAGHVEILDFEDICSYLQSSLPGYAVPLFLRVRETMATTGTFKYKKTDLKEEGFDINKVTDPLYALLPGTNEYVQLTQDIYHGICEGKYRY